MAIDLDSYEADLIKSRQAKLNSAYFGGLRYSWNEWDFLDRVNDDMEDPIAMRTALESIEDDRDGKFYRILLESIFSPLGASELQRLVIDQLCNIWQAEIILEDLAKDFILHCKNNPGFVIARIIRRVIRCSYEADDNFKELK